jgi:hypothetical protein
VPHDVAGDALGSVSHIKGAVLGHVIRCTLRQTKHQRDNLQDVIDIIRAPSDVGWYCYAGQVSPVDVRLSVGLPIASAVVCVASRWGFRPLCSPKQTWDGGAHTACRPTGPGSCQ